MCVCVRAYVIGMFSSVSRRRQLKTRSQTTDPLYSTSRFDEFDETQQQIPAADSVIYVSARSPAKEIAPPPAPLCSYHRYFRPRTESGNDAMWRERAPIYTATGDVDTVTSYPLLVHPGSALATPHFRITSSPEVARRQAASFRSADNLDSAGGSISTSPRPPRPRTPAADVVESIRRKRPMWTADRQQEPSETEILCSCTDHPATANCS